MGNMTMKWINRLMGKKEKNRSAMWISLFSVGIGAAVLGVLTGRGKDSNVPMKSMVKNFTSKNFTPNNFTPNFTPNTNINMMDDAALAEFSEELLTNALNNKRDQSGETHNNQFDNHADTPNNNQY